MDNKILEVIEKDQYKNRPDVRIGDTVKLHMRISEGGKDRTQIFEGIVIAMKGSGLSKTITVRKISYGIGVERIVPMHAPTLEKIEIIKRGDVRRAKLYYMRGRVGKLATKIKNVFQMYETDGEDVEELEVEMDENTAVAEEADTMTEDKVASNEVKEETTETVEEEVAETEEKEETKEVAE